MTKKPGKKKATRKSVPRSNPVKKAAEKRKKTAARKARPVRGKNQSSEKVHATRQKMLDYRALGTPDHITALILGTTEEVIVEKIGRGEVIIDYDEVYELYKINCTDAEVAAVLRISAATVARRKVEDRLYIDAHERGTAEYTMNIKRTQNEILNEPDGNGRTAMAIFLGKAKLGQSDKAQDETPQEFNFHVSYDQEGDDSVKRHRIRRASAD